MKEGRQIVFFTLPYPIGHNPDEEEEPNVLLRTRKVHYHSKWKPQQDAVYWINLVRVQEKGTAVWQSRSYGITVDDSLPAECIEKVVFRETSFLERVSHRVQLQ